MSSFVFPTGLSCSNISTGVALESLKERLKVEGYSRVSLKAVFAQPAPSFYLDCMFIYRGVLMEFIGAFPPRAIYFNNLPQHLALWRL